MDIHAASHTFAVVTAVKGVVISQDEFPATSAGVSRASTWVARRSAQSDKVLVVVENSGSDGAGVARTFARAGYTAAEAGAQLRGKGKTDALDAVRIAWSVLGLDTGSLRVPRADGTRNAPRIIVIARKMITRECTAATKALTSLVCTEDLGIDSHKALRIDQVRQVAGGRTRTDEPIDFRVTRLEATRLARQVLDLRTQAKDNERQLRDLVLQVARTCWRCAASGPARRLSSSSHGPTAARYARRQRSPRSQAPARPSLLGQHQALPRQQRTGPHAELGHPHHNYGPDGTRSRHQGLYRQAHRRGQDQARCDAMCQALRR